MANEFKYGNYNFSPKPLISISSEPYKTPDGTGYGVMRTINMDGVLILTGSQTDSGSPGVFNLIEGLYNALNADGKLLLIRCDTSTLVSGYPTIEPYEITDSFDNFTRTAKYNLTFKMPNLRTGISDPFNNNSMPPYIESCSDVWDIEFKDERMPFSWTISGSLIEKFGYEVAVTHTIDAKARITYTGSQQQSIPWDDAKKYVSDKLIWESDHFDSGLVNSNGQRGILGLPGTEFSTYYKYNNYRQVSVNKSDGSVQAVETFILSPSGSNSLPPNAIETFDISTTQNEGIFSVSINGEIRGLHSIAWANPKGADPYHTASMNTLDYKFNNASGYFNIVKPRLYYRAANVYSGFLQNENCFTSRSLNPVVKSRTIGVNPIDGIITYSYEYDTSFVGAITGNCIISQNITIDDQLEQDVFASQVILGRAAGPILQDIGTVTARTRTLNIELVTVPPTSVATIAQIYAPVPTGSVQAFIDIISGDLLANYSQVFVSSHTKNWNFTLGRYSESVSYTYNNCSN